MWKAEKVYYPPAIRETTSAHSEVVRAPQETETAQSEAVQLIFTPDEPTKGGELHEATRTPRGLNPKVSQEAAKSTVSAQVSNVEEPTFLVQPLQTIFLTDVSEGPESNPAQPSQEGDASQGLEANLIWPPQEITKAKLKKWEPWPIFVFVFILVINQFPFCFEDIGVYL